MGFRTQFHTDLIKCQLSLKKHNSFFVTKMSMVDYIWVALAFEEHDKMQWDLNHLPGTFSSL